MYREPIFLGVDVGRTKVEVCTFDAQHAMMSSSIHRTADFPTGADAFLGTLQQRVADKFSVSIQRIGVSFNGFVRDGWILYGALLGGEFRCHLADKWGREFGVSVTLENDANAMARAEARFGKGRDAHSFVLINVGTGFRVAFVSDGNLVSGYTNCTGEITQRMITIPEFPGHEFKIGKVVSGMGIATIYQLLSGELQEAHEVLARRQTDEHARQAVSIFSRYLAEIFDEITCYYNPEKIILTGSVSKSADAYLPSVVEKHRQRTSRYFYCREVTVSELEHSACLGAILA